jgi:hypothetical protein
MRPQAAPLPQRQTPRNIMAETPTPDVVALVRRLYGEGAFVKEIVAQSGIKNLTIIYRCLAGLYPDGSGIKPVPIPQRRQGVRVRHRAGSRTALVTRMWRTAERQVEEIEDRLAVAGLELAEREGNARVMAIVAKTLRELKAVDEAETPRKGKKPADDDDTDDDVPRDIDEFRRELARRINALVDSRTGPGGADAS